MLKTVLHNPHLSLNLFHLLDCLFAPFHALLMLSNHLLSQSFLQEHPI